MELIKEYGNIGKYTAREVIWTKEEARALAGAAFPGRQVLDIRYYENGKPMQGVAFTDDMLTVMMLLISRLQAKEPDPEQHIKGIYKNIPFEIFDVYGTLLEGHQSNIVFTRTCFGENGIKYDIRPWKKDYSGFMLGLSLTDEEFNIPFIDTLMDADTDRKLTYPKMLSQQAEISDVARTCFSELVYQLDKMGVCFGKDNQENFEKFFADTCSFMKSWPKAAFTNAQK